MSGRHRIAVLGTGSLARAVCYSLAAVCRAPVDVVVVGRSEERSRQVAYVAGTRAVSGANADIGFRPATDLEAALRDVDGVLVCASSQSPWERLSAPSEWTALVGRAGYGITMPFQTELVLRAGRLLADRSPRPWLLNGCFPDAVNPLLAALGVPVLAGIGNIALLAASAQAALGLPDQRRLKMLGHHVHLHAPADGEDDVRVWLDEQASPAPGDLLALQRATDRTELNHVTGHDAALLLTALLSGTPTDTHLPGPLGLPGGYPVHLRGTDLTLRLPTGVGHADAVALNQRWAAADGVVVDEGRVRFGPRAAAELARLAPDLADGFAVGDLISATAELNLLRERLRGQPADRLPGVTA
ncbi:MAG TPA: hypothetical protein VNP92_12365 [Actinophytocola sp.]|nr:hypothetical protein [Actinophytocola sp.]